ncbi:MAG: glycosyltransferase [Bdellovibrionota bacterium]
MRVAIVHDWLLGMRGGERCLEVIASLFPTADIFTLFYDSGKMTPEINAHRVVSSRLDRLPGAKSIYRHLLPIYAFGVRDLERKIADGRYELIISISHCVAKNVRPRKGTYHLCYCLTPARYLWDQFEVYFGGKSYEPLVRMVAPALRRADIRGAAAVHHFVAISEFIRQRIRSLYQRDSDVAYPPVRTDWIKVDSAPPSGGFLAVNALVPYKNTELIVRAFNRLGLPLTVIGKGPDAKKLRALGKENIRFVENVTDEELAAYYSRSKALVFAAEEDFGMVPVEIQAAGRPVICYGRGGVLETVSATGEAPTGMYFSELSTDSLCRAIEHFTVRQADFTVDNCLRQSRKFSLDCFRESFCRVLDERGIEHSGAPQQDSRARSASGVGG